MSESVSNWISVALSWMAWKIVNYDRTPFLSHFQHLGVWKVRLGARIPNLVFKFRLNNIWRPFWQKTTGNCFLAFLAKKGQNSIRFEFEHMVWESQIWYLNLNVMLFWPFLVRKPKEMVFLVCKNFQYFFCRKGGKILSDRNLNTIFGILASRRTFQTPI